MNDFKNEYFEIISAMVKEDLSGIFVRLTNSEHTDFKSAFIPNDAFGQISFPENANKEKEWKEIAELLIGKKIKLKFE